MKKMRTTGHLSIAQIQENNNRNVNRKPEEQSKSFKGECGNAGCSNQRRDGSAYCQSCSDLNKHKNHEKKTN